MDLHLLCGVYVFPVLHLEFTALSWMADLSLCFYGKVAAAVMTSLASCVKDIEERRLSLCTLNLIAA